MNRRQKKRRFRYGLAIQPIRKRPINLVRMSGEGATIAVEREFGGVTDHLRAYKVLIDGDVAGELRAGETDSFEVSPGGHEIFMKIDWARSEKLEIQLEAGGMARFCCAPRANAFTNLYWASFGRRRCIKLAQVA